MISKQHSVRFLMTVCAVFALAIPAHAAKPAGKKLPAAVFASFEKSYPTAKVKNWSTEKNNGAVCYEVESVDGKTRRDLIYSADGAVLEIEEGMKPSDLPEPVTLAISKAYPKGVVKTAEKLTRGSFTGYEVAVRQGKKTHEVVLDSEGTIQKAPQGKSEKD